MTIAPDLVAQILRLHSAEKWRVGTIARQLHVHRDTVRRVLAVNVRISEERDRPFRHRDRRIRERDRSFR
jgi:AraC-like DNA-binding protein